MQSTEDVSVISQQVAAAYVQAHARPDAQGKAILVLGASLAWPGLGQFLAGRMASGLVFSVLWTGLIIGLMQVLQNPQLLPLMLVWLPVAVLLQVCQIFHAIWCARRTSKAILRDPLLRYVAGIVLGAGGVFCYCAGINYLQNNWFEICYSPTPSMSPAVSPGDLFLIYKQEPFTRWDIVGINSPERSLVAQMKESAKRLAAASGHQVEFTDTQMIVDGRAMPTPLPPPNLVKRIVGLPHDKIEITGFGLLIDGKSVSLPPNVGPYISTDRYEQPLAGTQPYFAATGCWGNPITLGGDEYYVLGDNSAISGDSRYFPAVGVHQPGAIPREDIMGRVVARIWPPDRWCIFGAAPPPPGSQSLDH